VLGVSGVVSATLPHELSAHLRVHEGAGAVPQPSVRALAVCTRRYEDQERPGSCRGATHAGLALGGPRGGRAWRSRRN
jgi:hypothetical protein